MSIYDKLYPFQKNVVDKFRSYKKFGLFLDMGLGQQNTNKLGVSRSQQLLESVDCDDKRQSTRTCDRAWVVA